MKVLVLKMLPFKLTDLVLDPGGRYLIIYAQIQCQPWVIVQLYLPPLGTFRLLNQIAAKIVSYR